MVQSGEFLDHTTNRVDYNRKKGERSQAIRPPEHLVQSGEFSGNTTHKVDYGAKEAERMQPFRPSQQAIESGDFDGTTTNRVDFVRKQGGRSQAIRPESHTVQTGPFYGQSTHKADFEPKKVDLQSFRLSSYILLLLLLKGERSQAIRPSQHAIQSGEFYGDTTHKVDFERKQVS